MYARITESWLEKTCKTIKSNREPNMALSRQGLPQTLQQTINFILGELPRDSEPAVQSSAFTPRPLRPPRTRILHEAEAAGGFLHFVQPHDDLLDVAAFAEEFVDLLLRGVEGQVPHIQRTALPQQPLLVVPRSLGRKDTASPHSPARPGRTARRPPPAAAHPEMLVPVLAEFGVGVAAQDAQRPAAAHGGAALPCPARPRRGQPNAAQPGSAVPSTGQTDTTRPSRLPASSRVPRTRPAAAQPMARRCAALASAAGRGARRVSFGAGCRESGGYGAAAGAVAAALQPAARGAALGVAAHPRRRSAHRQRPHPRPARPGPAPASPARRLPRRDQGRRPRAGVAVAARAGPRRPPRICAVIAAPSGSSCGQRPGGTGTERTERVEPAGEGPRQPLWTQRCSSCGWRTADWTVRSTWHGLD